MKQRTLCMLFAFLLLACHAAQGGLIIEDFSYPNTTNMNTNPNGGSGWSGGWGTGGSSGLTSTITINSSDLLYSAGGYSVQQTGVGRPGGSNTSGFRGVNRNIASPVTSGTAWFSILVKDYATTGSAGIQFNNAASTDYNPSTYWVALDGDTLDVLYNGVSTPGIASGFTVGDVHLILGKWDISSSGNDTLSVWVDPPNVTSLGAPLFSDNSADLGASGLTRLGIETYGSGGGAVDALRFSDTASGLSDVTVPEPATLFLLGTLAPSLLLLTWRHHVRQRRLARASCSGPFELRG